MTPSFRPFFVATLLRFEKEEFVKKAHQKTAKNKRKNSNLV
jgi:hypothetical protein